ncbi:glycoside hydrolase family 2 protein [Agaribacterium haliotis]|uniref:glycoside hydrolase family 2 protein n=1 Tax=Agaribacterium haliotis TaxID=2013869 RepID=UPI00195C4636|nr:sugar-binding domain-containing protein [Agaribacterium haliotis]
MVIWFAGGLAWAYAAAAAAEYQPKFSSAGFYELADSGREVYSLNPQWRFYKGELSGAEAPGLDDSRWPLVNLPHGIEYLPVNASGGVNYRGVSWYRKRLPLASAFKNKKLFLNFEGIMGKAEIYVNGHLLKQHFGGYLPAVVDISAYVNLGEDNIIAVKADNSDDANFPPGKPQAGLDFTYFGGIYRDVWLVSHNKLYISDANYQDKVAGGGLFVRYKHVSDSSAEIDVQAHIVNEKAEDFSGLLNYVVKDKGGHIVAQSRSAINVAAKSDASVSATIKLNKPNLWSPQSPYLYELEVRIKGGNKRVIDGYKRRIGVRSVEFKGWANGGFWLNGKAYKRPLIGANRHQDFAVLGHALPNSLHWRDAKKLKDAGFDLIRNAHFPQDPAFMDAADELGLLVIVTTPGWQFWNDEGPFEERVYADIKNMIRRDRNHASAFLWEPILNETWYPEYFAEKVKTLVEREQPGAYAASDAHAKGGEIFPVQYGAAPSPELADAKVSYFTREWGDWVDDWNAQNSFSRINRAWGEEPMLHQARWYSYILDSIWGAVKSSNGGYFGGALWHPFDHQRGYHPDPFQGGAMDSFRQPKLSYHMFQSQRPRQFNADSLTDTGPYIYVAHELTPFSSSDVEVYSNCDEVSLQVHKDGKVYRQSTAQADHPHRKAIVKFENVYDFNDMHTLGHALTPRDAFLWARCFIAGKEVADHKKYASLRPSQLLLSVDNEGLDLQADGSDKVVVVAAMADKDAVVKRFDRHFIEFSVQGPAKIVSADGLNLNPKQIEWGTAAIILESTDVAGVITVTAKVQFAGEHQPQSASLSFSSVEPSLKYLKQYDTSPMVQPKAERDQSKYIAQLLQQNLKLKKQLAEQERLKTEKLQQEFESSH